MYIKSILTNLKYFKYNTNYAIEIFNKNFRRDRK